MAAMTTTTTITADMKSAKAHDSGRSGASIIAAHGLEISRSAGATQEHEIPEGLRALGAQS